MAKICPAAGREGRSEPFKEWIETWGSHKAEAFPTVIAMRPF